MGAANTKQAFEISLHCNRYPRAGLDSLGLGLDLGLDDVRICKDKDDDSAAQVARLVCARMGDRWAVEYLTDDFLICTMMAMAMACLRADGCWLLGARETANDMDHRATLH